MPNIPIANPTRQFGDIPESGVQASPDAFGYQVHRQEYANAMAKMDGLGRAQAAQTQGIWGTVAKVGNVVVDQLQRDAKLDADTKMAEFELEMRKQLDANEATGNGDYTKKALEVFDEKAAQLKEGAGLWQGERFEQGLSRMRLSLQEQAYGKEAGALKAQRIDNAGKLIDAGEVGVYRAPGSVGTVIAETVAKIEESGLTPDQKSRAIEDVNKRYHSVAIGKYLSDGNIDAARKLFDAPGTAEALGGLESLRTRSTIDKAAEDWKEKNEAIEMAKNLSNGTAVIDPEDTKQRTVVDKAWKTAGGNGQLLQGDPNAANVVVGWTKQHGIVPSSALSTLNAMAKNGEPAQRAYAYQTVNQMEAVRPGVVDNSGAKNGLLKDAEKFRYYTSDLGLGQEEALKRLEAQRTPEFKAKEDIRKKEASKLAGERTAAELADAYDASAWRGDPALGAPGREDIIVGVYKKAFEEHYVETGDEDVAKALAMKDMKRTYNRTMVSGDPRWGGQGRVIKHPPEVYYAQINGSHQWIRDQLVADVKTALPGKNIKDEDIFIESVRATDEAITSSPSGQAPRPVYAVIYKDQNGAYQTIPGKLFKPDENGARAKATGAAERERQGLADQANVEKQQQTQAQERALQESRIQAEAARTFNQPKDGVVGDPSYISRRLETGDTDPMRGVAQIANDTAGTKSYGNYGLNSGGSAQAFVREYGKDLGLTGQPGTAAFDRSWREAAARDPKALHAAEQEWYQKEVLNPIVTKLHQAGVPTNIAADKRVTAYFADRVVQQGPGSIADSKKHRARIADAAREANGDPVRFLQIMTEYDRAALKSDFPRALKTGNYSKKANDNRTGGREKMALGFGPAYDQDKVQSIVDLFGFGYVASMNNALH